MFQFFLLFSLPFINIYSFYHLHTALNKAYIVTILNFTWRTLFARNRVWWSRYVYYASTANFFTEERTTSPSVSVWN